VSFAQISCLDFVVLYNDQIFIHFFKRSIFLPMHESHYSALEEQPVYHISTELHLTVVRRTVVTQHHDLSFSRSHLPVNFLQPLLSNVARRPSIFVGLIRNTKFLNVLETVDFRFCQLSVARVSLNHPYCKQATTLRVPWALCCRQRQCS